MKPALEPTRRSIRRWLLWALLSALGFTVALDTWMEYTIVDRPVHLAFDHALQDDAHAIAGYLRADNGRLRLDLPAGAEQVLRTDPEDTLYFLVRGPHGEVLGGDPSLTVPPANEGAVDATFEAVYRGEPIRGVSAVHRTDLGPVSIHIAQTKHARSQLNRRLAAAILVSNVFLLAITLGLAYVVVGAGLRPLIRLSREIEARGADMLTPVSHEGLPVELQPVATAINKLLSVIDGATRAQRRFLADASHQLRTPLTGLQGQLDLLSHENLPEAAHDRIVALHHATRRLSHLASQLLALGHSDAMAAPRIKMESSDLADVVESSASVFLDRALEKDIDLGFEAANAPVVACPWMIREMTYNLIDNAIVYTQAGGRITVRSGVRNGGTAVLEVEDNGPGIPVADRQRVFERFFRGTQSDGVGCGLGLAIVKQIADAHGAQVSITDPDSGPGTLFRVRFPAASSAAPEAQMESG